MMKDNIQIHLDGSRIQQALWIADKVQSEMAKENLTDLWDPLKGTAKLLCST